MLLYAQISTVVAIVSVLLIAGACLSPVKVQTGSLADSGLMAIFGCFWLSVLVTQPLLAFSLHETDIQAWRLVGLYFTAICIFLAELPLLAEMSDDILTVPIVPKLPAELINACLAVFGICWLAQVAMFLTR